MKIPESGIRFASVPVFVLLLAFGSRPLLAAEYLTDPIREVKKIEVGQSAFDKKLVDKQPILIKDEKTASRYFDKDALKKLKGVDFEEQHILVFAWSGSGQDKIKYVVAESFPEQITFRIERGRTRDLRKHARVFVIRSNVRWKFEK